MEYEEFENLQLDRPSLHVLRSDEQIRKHTLDRNLEKRPVDRGLHLLTKGDEIQKLSVIQTLPSLLAGDPQSCIQRLMPKMQQTLPTASTEFHVAASSTFKTILEQRLVSHSTFTQTFLQSILNSLDSRDQTVANAWLETLLDVIELLPADVIGREILPVAINKGQLSQPVSSRIICCKLLGKICTRFDSQMIKKDVLPTVHSLCQDVNGDVRECMCLQLHYVAEGLGPESVKSSLLPSIVELASDEESNVRHASVQTIVYLLPHLQADIITSTILPLIKKTCEHALKSHDIVIYVIAKEFGKIAIGLEKYLTAVDKAWFLKYFRQLAQVGVTLLKNENDSEKHQQQQQQQQPPDFQNVKTTENYVECRRPCAFNIPAMFLFASSTSEDVDILLPTFSTLASDPFYMIRRAIACGFHEVAKILGPKNHLIKKEFIKLLKDDNEEVLQGLIPHIAQTLELLTLSKTIGTEQADATVMELGRALLKCEGEVFNTNNWRLSKCILEQLEILPKCFPSVYIYTYFVPVTFNRALNARPMPVRLAAGRTLLVFIRYNLTSGQRTELRNRIFTEFARNPSCYVRMLFLRMMVEAMAIFSSNYFKEHFYSTVLSMSDDPIANIRLKLVTLLPMLKSYLRLPSDKKLLSSFESTIRNLMNNEKDRDVIFSLTNAIRKLDEIDVRHEGQTSSTKLTKQDMEDVRKFEEEKRLLSTTTAISGKATPVAIKKGSLTAGRLNIGDGSTSHGAKQTINESLSKSSITSSQKAKQAGMSDSTTDSTFKSSNRQTSSSPRTFDPSKASRHVTAIMYDFSTSSDSLTSSWARLTSNRRNRLLLTSLWERIDHPEPLDSTKTSSSSSSTSITNTILKLNNDDRDDYNITNTAYCGCRTTSSFIYPSPLSSPGNLESADIPKNPHSTSCSCHNIDSKSKDLYFLHKHNYYNTSTSLLTTPLRLTTYSKDNNHRHEHLQHYFSPTSRDNNYDNTTPNFAALRAVTNAAQYNSCWAFSSMPEIPVTLLDDEFLVDTGVRIPAQLSSSSSTSKIPNLQDIIYRNTRIGNVNKSTRWTGGGNFDKNKQKMHYSMHENCSKRSGSDKKSSNRLSMNFDDRTSIKMQLNDDFKDKRYWVMRGKCPIGSDSSSSILDDKNKRSSFILDRDKKLPLRDASIGSSGSSDKFKRYSASYNYKLSETKDCSSKHQKFKRHSLEVTDYTPVDYGQNRGRLKRNFTLDVNHNQGSSKIPLRNNIAVLSGSRTAPVTRASSPIRLRPQLSFNTEAETTMDYSSGSGGGGGGERSLTKFSSSDEDVDKLCIRFAYVDTTCVKGDYTRNKSISKLPVWIPRKKP